jgi:hypothetical protein
MKINMLKNIFPVAAITFLAACNLSKEVEIELPEYERQPVVECYLEPGKPFRLLLTQSYGFFDPFALDTNLVSFAQKTLLQNALVTITYNGRTDTLANPPIPVFEENPIKFFNYVGTNLVPATPGTEFVLNITLPANGGNATGRTTMLPLVPIDSIVVEFSTTADSLARNLTYITDDQNEVNFYRRMLHYSSLDSLPEQDFLVTDRFSTTSLIAFGSGYEAKEGDTVFNTIFHIERAYYDYAESVQLAVIGNLNPFAQPSPIKSNVSGTANPLGIFTCLVYDRDTTIVRR